MATPAPHPGGGRRGEGVGDYNGKGQVGTTKAPIGRSRIFISYRHEADEYAVGRLAEELRKHFPHDQVFEDIASIDPGADFVDALQRGLDTCAAFLVVIGPNWPTITDRQGQRRLDSPDDWVRHEVVESLRNPGVRVFPLLLDAEMPSAEDLPEPMRPLTRRQAFSLTGRHWANDTARLIEFLKKVPGLATRPPVEPRAPAAKRASKPPPQIPARPMGSGCESSKTKASSDRNSQHDHLKTPELETPSAGENDEQAVAGDEVASASRFEKGAARIEPEPTGSFHPTGQTVSGKNPWVALALSFVIPGVGQFYNGDHSKGAVILIGAIVGGLVSGGVLTIPVWIWAMIDAYKVASGQGKTWPPIVNAPDIRFRPTTLIVWVVLVGLVVALVWVLFVKGKGI